MTVAELIPLAIKASIWLIALNVGLGALPRDLVLVVRRPLLLGRSLLAMGVIMPAVAVVLVKVMSLPAPTAIALVALSLSPIPPFLPKKQIKAGGDAAYTVGLMAAAALVSIVWIPLVIEVLDPLFAGSLQVTSGSLVSLLCLTILLPLLLGALINRFASSVAAGLAKVVGPGSMVLLLLALVPVAISKGGDVVAQARDGTVLAFALFIVVGLVVGYALGGPDPEHRSVLALASASRHPAIAIAIAHLNFPNQHAVAPTVLLYLIAAAVLSTPFVAWRRRATQRAAPP